MRAVRTLWVGRMDWMIGDPLKRAIELSIPRAPDKGSESYQSYGSRWSNHYTPVVHHWMYQSCFQTDGDIIGCDRHPQTAIASVCQHLMSNVQYPISIHHYTWPRNVRRDSIICISRVPKAVSIRFFLSLGFYFLVKFSFIIWSFRNIRKSPPIRQLPSLSGHPSSSLLAGDALPCSSLGQ